VGMSGLPLGNLEIKCHLDVSDMASHRVYYEGGRWWLPPSPGCGESCESEFTHGSS
jgi:hypothetical protein